MDLKITDCAENDVDLIYKGITENNSRKVPELFNGKYYEINKKISDENGAVIAGCLAEVNQWNALHVGILCKRGIPKARPRFKTAERGGSDSREKRLHTCSFKHV